MNASTETKKKEELSLTQTVAALARYYLGGRRGLILLTVIALGAGLVLNWSWLVAVGLAPLLLALAPCAAMCALGLCMKKLANKSGSVQSSAGEEDTGPGPVSTTTVTTASEETAAPVACGDSERSLEAGEDHDPPKEPRKELTI